MNIETAFEESLFKYKPQFEAVWNKGFESHSNSAASNSKGRQAITIRISMSEVPHGLLNLYVEVIIASKCRIHHL